ncbi:MAG: polysaccharide biosynthesis tyrosine autokinase [Clostridia bacterium]|nr:polysaccharide biosynthesis tyrosine autokinase [Clostridia bacterium]
MEEVDFQQLFRVFWKHKISIFLVTILGLVIGYVYNARFTTPLYKATTTFLLSSSNGMENIEGSAITTTDVTLNSKIINNYTELIKSDIILGETISRTNVNIDKSFLKKNISVKVKNDTEFVELSVTLPNKEQSAVIANEIIVILNERIKEMYNMENVRLVDSATVPTSPCNINPIKYGVMGAGISFALICILFFIFSLYDDSVKSEEDLENKLHVPVLAKFNKQSNAASLEWNLKSDYVEDFKTLRTNLQFSKALKRKQTIAISSLYPKEGKSWVTANLAIAFSKADYKVLLVDADLRKGSQHIKFNVDQKPGLVELIKSLRSPEDLSNCKKFIQATEVNNLYVLPSGGNILDSSELLLSNKVKKIVNELKKDFDIIIFDSTPSALVSDAVVLSRLVDTNIIVTEYEKSKVRDLRKMKRSIESIGGNVCGVVINKIDRKASKKSYYYYGVEQDLISTNHSRKYSKHHNARYKTHSE